MKHFVKYCVYLDVLLMGSIYVIKSIFLRGTRFQVKHLLRVPPRQHVLGFSTSPECYKVVWGVYNGLWNSCLEVEWARSIVRILSQFTFVFSVRGRGTPLCIKQDALYMAIYRSIFGYIWLYMPIYGYIIYIYDYIYIYMIIYIYIYDYI